MGADGAADGLADEGMNERPFEAVAVTVDVDTSPVKTPEGPTTIGMMTSKVLPLPSVVVCVRVDFRVAVKP